jgi:hypothetical protein
MLRIQMKNVTAGIIDEVMSASQINEKWRQATFFYKCSTNHDQQTWKPSLLCKKFLPHIP